MWPGNETIVLIQKCLGAEGIFGAVEGNGNAIIDLNCIGAVVWPNRTINFHVRT